MMLMDMLHHPGMEEEGGRALGWLMVISVFRDDAPWLYELGLDVYRALQKDDDWEISRAIDRFEKTLAVAKRGPMAELMIDGPEVDMAVHELARVARHVLREGHPMRPPKPRPKVGDGGET
jgi:hypothetical protein